MKYKLIPFILIFLIFISFSDADDITLRENFPYNTYKVSNLNLLTGNYTNLVDNAMYLQTFQGIYNISTENYTLKFENANVGSYFGAWGSIRFDRCVEGIYGYPCYIKNYTRIAFDVKCENYALGGTDKRSWFGLIQNTLDTYDSTLGINSSKQPFSSYLRRLDAGGTECKIQDITGVNPCNDDWIHVNFSIQDVLNNDPNCDIRYNLPFDSFRFSFWREDGSGKNINQSLDNITITNVSYDKNKLPSVNMTADSYACINDTSQSILIPLNISTYDIEGDTIYYAYTTNNVKNVLNTITFNKQTCNFFSCYNDADYNFYKYFVHGEGNTTSSSPPTTTITENCEFNFTEHSTINENHEFLELVYKPNADKYGLYLPTTCIGNKELIMRFIQPLDYVFFNMPVYDLQNGKEFNLSFIDHFSKLAFRVILKRENDKTLVYSWNRTLMLNITYTNPIDFTILQYANNTNLITINNVYNGFSLIDETSQNTSEYFKFSWNSDVWIPYVHYSGVGMVLDFKTEKPTHFNITGIGLKEYTLYYTDYANLGSSYNSTSVDTQVVLCSKLPDGVNSDNGFNVLKTIKTYLGKSLKDYLVVLGYYELGKTILWTIFILMFLGMMLSQYLLTKELSFVFPLFVSSFSCLILSYLVDYTSHLISFILLVAFSLATPLARHYGGGNN